MSNNKIHNPKLNANARSLRINQTEQERELWYRFLRTLPIRFKRQVTIGNYIADFYCSKANVVIEIDGSQHYTDNAEEYDKLRTDYFNSLGITELRYSNIDINTKFNDVCSDIYNFLNSNGYLK